MSVELLQKVEAEGKCEQLEKSRVIDFADSRRIRAVSNSGQFTVTKHSVKISQCSIIDLGSQVPHITMKLVHELVFLTNLSLVHELFFVVHTHITHNPWNLMLSCALACLTLTP